MTTVISLSKYRREFNCQLFSLFYFPLLPTHPILLLLYFFEKGGIEKCLHIFCKNYRNVITSKNMIFNVIWSKIVCDIKLLPDGL